MALRGVEKKSTPSKKKGLFSGKKSANRSLTASWAASASTWEKSGFTVAFKLVFGVMLHLAVIPGSMSLLSGSRPPDGKSGTDIGPIHGQRRVELEVPSWFNVLKSLDFVGLAKEACVIAISHVRRYPMAVGSRIGTAQHDAPGLLTLGPRKAYLIEGDGHLDFVTNDY